MRYKFGIWDSSGPCSKSNSSIVKSTVLIGHVETCGGEDSEGSLECFYTYIIFFSKTKDTFKARKVCLGNIYILSEAYDHNNFQ